MVRVPTTDPESSDKNRPTERQLVAMLRDLEPEPSQRFYQFMRGAPWKAAPRREGLGLFRRLAQRLPTVLRPSIIILAVLTTILLGLFAFPSTRAIAQEVIRFFARTDGDRVVIQVPSGQPDVVELAAALSVDEAEDLAGFSVKEPSELPYPFVLRGASYDPARQAVVLDYSRGGRILRLTVRPDSFLSEIDPTFHVGASAVVESVRIGDLEGEYVKGYAWRSADSPSEGSTEFEWAPDASSRVLRWRDGDLYYELWNAGGSPGHPGYLDKEDLISLATGLQ